MHHPSTLVEKNEQAALNELTKRQEQTVPPGTLDVLKASAALALPEEEFHGEVAVVDGTEAYQSGPELEDLAREPEPAVTFDAPKNTPELEALERIYAIVAPRAILSSRNCDRIKTICQEVLFASERHPEDV